MDETPSNPAAELASRPGFLIRRLHQIHLALFAEECAGIGVTPVQYSIMTVAAANPGLEQGKLGHAIGVDRATLANVVARLEARGLLRRSACKGDRRTKLVELTNQGGLVLNDMDAAARRAHERTIEALDPAERAVFMRGLAQLVEAGNAYGRAPLQLR